MIVTLDGQRVEACFTPGHTLEQLIDQLRAAHLHGRVIISVALDGVVLDDASLNAHLVQPVAEDVQVDLESSEASTLVAGALRGLAEEFRRAAGQLAATADRLCAGEVAAAMGEVGTFVALWQTAYRVIAQCSGLLQTDLTTWELDGRKLGDCFGPLIDKLRDLRDALDARDAVLLADLVRYELPPLTETWQGLLTTLADRVEQAEPT